MKLLHFLFAVAVATQLLSIYAEADAGIFRRGPMLPWRHQQWDGPDTPTPSQPLPPPILEPVFTGPSPEEIEEDKRLEELKEKAEKMEETEKANTEVSSADPNNKLPFSLPIWLPLAGAGLGVAGAGVKRVRSRVGSIVSE